jgi:hypothetical protein
MSFLCLFFAAAIQQPYVSGVEIVQNFMFIDLEIKRPIIINDYSTKINAVNDKINSEIFDALFPALLFSI